MRSNFKKMKKLIVLLAAVLLTATSVEVMAQSSGTNPAPGATHSYFITPGNTDNAIQWTVFQDDFSTEATEVVIESANSGTTNITWPSTADPDDWYYVQVVETELEGCSNTKVLPVQIKESNFYLTLEAANVTACYDNAVSVSIVSNAPVYSHGKATIEFTVTPANLSGSYTGYTFDLELNVPDGFDYTTTAPEFSSNAGWDGTTVTVTDNNLVTVSFIIDNTNTYDNSSASDAQNFTAIASVSNGVTANGVLENDSDDDNTDSTQVARPNTSGIGTN